MSQSGPADSGRCSLCGRELPAVHVECEDEAFCSEGCRDVSRELGPSDDGGANAPATTSDAGDDAGADTRVYLHVDGMYSATCESFLERVAEDCAGVSDAEASYVTEAVRVDYDPERVTASELCEALSVLGYTAVPRDESSPTVGEAARRGAAGERGIDDLLGHRYVVGVVFGSFLLLPYVVLFYPAHLSAFLGPGALDMFAPTAGLGGDAVFVLPTFALLTGVVVFFTGLPVLRGAYVGLKMRRPNTDLLVALTALGAFAYSTVAFSIGRIDVYYDLTVVVAAGVVAAVFYESLSKRRATDRLSELTVSQVTEARRRDADGTVVPVDELEPGDEVLVREGERIPVDGVLVEDGCTVDEAVVTGESLPVPKRAGDDVVGGAVVTNGAAVIRVGDGATSSIDRLVTSVWDLQSAAHGVQRGADRVASLVAPLVAAGAVAVGAGSLALGSSVPVAALAGLTVFLVGCPWALGLATPLSVATSIEQAVERGVVVFDETMFERLRDVDVAVFDKTGTITTGDMEVLDADGPPESLAAAAALERRASHPVADAIVTAFGAGDDARGDDVQADGGLVDEDQKDVRPDDVREFESHPNGVEGIVGDARVLVGNLDLFAEREWSVDDAVETRAREARRAGRLPVVVGRDGHAEGVVVVGDEPRDGWDETVSRLTDRGVDVVVLSGDTREATESLADHPGVDHVFAGVPPAGKTATVRRLQSAGRVAMVGDGTNDAPALAQADLGISLGSGTALASDAADVALVEDDLTAVVTAFDLADAAGRRVTQNNAIALLYNAVTIPLAVVGILNPLFATAAVVATAGLLAGNSFRPLLAE